MLFWLIGARASSDSMLTYCKVHDLEHIFNQSEYVVLCNKMHTNVCLCSCASEYFNQGSPMISTASVVDLAIGAQDTSSVSHTDVHCGISLIYLPSELKFNGIISLIQNDMNRSPLNFLNSCVIVAYSKFGSDMIAFDGDPSKPKFRRNWLRREIVTYITVTS